MFKNYSFYILISSIIAISYIGNWYVFETNKTETIGRFEKTIIIAVWFLAIAFLGYLALKLLNKNWVIALWLMQYAFALMLCIIYVGIYFLATTFPITIKTAMASIRNFYLTPFPFALLLIMEVVENKKRSNV
jgi:hypothetical protein